MAATVERGNDVRNYYDYRRSNDGVSDFNNGDEQRLEADESGARSSSEALSGSETTDDNGAPSPPLDDVDQKDGHQDWGLFFPWRRASRRKSSSHDGQSHYHLLHHKAIKHGVREHLREIFGLGSELETYDNEVDHETSAKRASRPSHTPEWAALEVHAKEVKRLHLRDLLADEARVAMLSLDDNATGVYMDWSRHKVTTETMRLLIELARRMDVDGKRERMRSGEEINSSERRPALHFALRAEETDLNPGGFLQQQSDSLVNEAVRSSAAVRQRIWNFAEAVRSGVITTPRGRRFESVVVVGIGGSYLGPEFITSSIGRQPGDPKLRFVANVDPEAFDRETADLDAASALVVVVSKSWTTAETLRNANRVRDWILAAYNDDEDLRTVVASHFCACASRGAADKVAAWGIDADKRLFEFWSWVGGRYSSSASAGLLPLALTSGSTKAKAFLDGARRVDRHFFNQPLERNVPAVMALLGIWNVNFLGLGARAVVPYAHGLARFAAHVQQLEMESNGKSVNVDGRPLDYTTGEIVFGEPGTNAQHSFFQLLHMGQCVPCDFIGFLAPADGQADVDGHRELMANFFAQPDALALGRPFEDVVNDVLVGASDDVHLCPHRTLSGDRPSLTILLPKLDAGSVGALLALYEHRTAVQGWTWHINSWYVILR